MKSQRNKNFKETIAVHKMMMYANLRNAFIDIGFSKSSFGIFCYILWKNQSKLFGQPSTFLSALTFSVNKV